MRLMRTRFAFHPRPFFGLSAQGNLKRRMSKGYANSLALRPG
jgi:hypothetical protein